MVKKQDTTNMTYAELLSYVRVLEGAVFGTASANSWGGRRPGAGRKASGVVKRSHRLVCSKRVLEALKEYARVRGELDIVEIFTDRVHYIERDEVKVRYIYLSADEWELVKPVYAEYKKM